MLTIYLLAATQGLLLSLALFTKNRKKFKANPFLGIIVFIVSLELLVQWIIETGRLNNGLTIPFWVLQSYLLIPPSIWAFNRINHGQSIKTKTIVLIFSPAVIEVIAEVSTYFYFLLSRQSINLIKFPLWFLFTEVLPILGTMGVLTAEGILLYKMYLKRTDKIKLSWNEIKHLTLFIILTLITTLWTLGEFFNPALFGYLNFVLVTFLFGLGYLAYFDIQFFTIAEKNQFENFNDQYETDQLIRIMKTRSLYLRPKISLKELSEEVNLPSRYVSHLINKLHFPNFQSFINSYRINEVLTKLKDPKQSHKTILALAYESGFNSKSSFNKIFKEHTGSTPSEFLRNTSEV